MNNTVSSGSCGKNLSKARCNYSSWEFGQCIGVDTPTSLGASWFISLNDFK